MIKTKTKGSLVVISGPSGAGKGTIISELKKDDSIWVSISLTSRLPRENEIDGVSYFFVSKEEFENRINQGLILEYNVYNNNYYGTPMNEIEKKRNEGKDVILEIDINGALSINNLISDAIFIFIMPPSMEELKKRLYQRNTENKEIILNRFKTAYKEINEINNYNYVVVNDVLESAINKVKSILLSEKCRADRIEAIDLNNQEELIHEILVDMREE